MKYITYDYDPETITPELIASEDWDVIELKVTFDIEQFTRWHNEVVRKYFNLFFNIRRPERAHVTPDFYPENIKNTLEKKLDSLSSRTQGYEIIRYTQNIGENDDLFVCQMSWYAERDDFALPFKWCVNPEVFPEANDPTLEMKVQEKYKFGYFKKVFDFFGDKYLNSACLRYHQPNGKFDVHTDSAIPSIRMHIPIITHDRANFFFGKNNERRYVLRPGRAYLINSGAPHSTENHNDIRSHLQTKVNLDDVISKLRFMNQHIG